MIMSSPHVWSQINLSVFTVKNIFNNCRDDFILISILANNKDSLYPLLFCPSQPEFKFLPSSWSLFTIHFPSNSDVTAQLTPALEQNQYLNTERGWQRSQTWNTGMPVRDNIRAKMKDGGSSPPGCRPSWISEFLSSSGAFRAGRMAGCAVGVCPFSVSPSRGFCKEKKERKGCVCLIALHFWPPRGIAVSAATSESCRDAGGPSHRLWDSCQD